MPCVYDTQRTPVLSLPTIAHTHTAKLLLYAENYHVLIKFQVFTVQILSYATVWFL